MVLPGVLAPMVPKWGSRFGEQRTAAAANALSSAVWLVAGTLVLLSSVPVRVVYLAGLIGGFPVAVNAVYKPLLSKAFLTGEGLAMARAYQGAIGGVAFALGSLVGGAIVNRAGPGWALIGNGVLTAPIAAVCWFGRPARRVPAGRVFHNGWAEARVLAGRGSALRLVLLFVSVAFLCIGPFTSMAVPIAAAVRNARPNALAGNVVSGAALLMAALALGRIVAMKVVRELGTRVGALVGLTLVDAATGAGVLLFALASSVLGGLVQLGFWAVAGLAIGTTYYSAAAFCSGAIGDSVDTGDQALGMASLMVVAAVMAPVASLAWGVDLDRLPVEVVLGVSGVCMVIAAVVTHPRAVAVRNATGERAGEAPAPV